MPSYTHCWLHPWSQQNYVTTHQFQPLPPTRSQNPKKEHKCCSCLGFRLLLAFFFDAVPAPPIPGYPCRFTNLWQALTTSRLTPPSLEHETEGPNLNMMWGFPPSFLCDASRNRTLLATQIYYICVNSKYYNLIFFQMSEINGWIGYSPLLSSHYWRLHLIKYNFA